jgi:hypothetical protein
MKKCRFTLLCEKTDDVFAQGTINIDGDAITRAVINGCKDPTHTEEHHKKEIDEMGGPAGIENQFALAFEKGLNLLLPVRARVDAMKD